MSFSTDPSRPLNAAPTCSSVSPSSEHDGDKSMRLLIPAGDGIRNFNNLPNHDGGMVDVTTHSKVYDSTAHLGLV